jgi:protein-tyrosine phosphatase
MPSAVSEVTVERDERGLTVVWEIAGEDVGVEVGVGPTPDGADHEYTVSVPAGGRSVHFDGWPNLAERRLYVSVTPSSKLDSEDGGGFRGQASTADLVPKGAGLIAGERRVRFEQVTNFRDLGGYPTADGRRTRWGRVFRSDALHRLTDRDLVLYESLGLRVVYDLRHDAERERNPDPFPSVSLSLLANVAVGGPRPDAPPPGSLGGLAQDAIAGERTLRDAYVGMLADVGPLFGRLLTGLAAADGLPAVFHCTGGKDRTGMSAALLLELLGVPRPMVLDDYELTSQFRRREHQTETYENLLAIGMSPEAAGAVLGTPRWVMEDALSVVDHDYGGVERYLTERAGMPGETLDQLRNLLTG